MNKKYRQHILNLWRWLAITDELEPSDIIFLFGSPSLRTPRKGAELFKKGLASYVVCTGHFSATEDDAFKATLAEAYSDELIKNGVPKDRIIVQDKSKNTPEDIKLAVPILEENNIPHKNAILVASSFHQRRAYATFKKLQPKIKTINCPHIRVDESLINKDSPRYNILDNLIKEYEKIQLYGDKSDLIPQPPPKDVQKSFKYLTSLI